MVVVVCSGYLVGWMGAGSIVGEHWCRVDGPASWFDYARASLLLLIGVSMVVSVLRYVLVMSCLAILML